MLQIDTEEKKAAVRAILRDTSVWFDFAEQREGVHIDDFITFDMMAEIVDYLRGEENARRTKARFAALRANIDGLLVGIDTISLRGAKRDEAITFIQSLGQLGYGVDTLMEEYNETQKITI